MKIEKLKEENVSEWDKIIAKNKNAKFQHLLEFKNVLEKTYKNCESKYFILKNKAIFPFFLVKSKLLGNRIISVPFLDAGGFLGDYNKENLKEIIKKLKKENITHIEIRINSSFKNFKENKKILSELKFIPDFSKQQFIINLTSEKEMWNKFHKHTRNDIRKSEKSNLVLKKIDDKNELKMFYKLYSKNMKYFGTPQHSYDFFKNLFEMANKNITGFNCYYENNLAGSIILFYNGKYGYVSYNVSNPKYRQYRPNDFLYWQGIKWSMKNKIKYLDLGQIDKKATDERAIGLYKFKRKWLGKEYGRVYFYYDLYKKQNKKEKKDKLKKFRSVWKKIPGTRVIGPKIASQLGI